MNEEHDQALAQLISNVHARYASEKAERKQLRMKRMADEWIAICKISRELMRATLIQMGVDLEVILEEFRVRDEDDRAGSGIFRRYKDIYLESLPSFGELLLQNAIDDDNSTSASDFPWQLWLERFSGSGFVDPRISNKYKLTVSGIIAEEELRFQYRKVIENTSLAYRELEEEKIVLHNMERAKEDMCSVDSIGASSSSHETRDEEEEDTLQSWVAMNSKNILHKQRNKTNHAKQMVDNNNRQLERTRKDWMKSLTKKKQPLSREEYQEWTELLLELSADMIPHLARHIIDRHEEEIDELAALHSKSQSNQQSVFNALQNIQTQLDTSPPYVWIEAVRRIKHVNILPLSLGGSPENKHLAWYGDKILGMAVASSLFSLFDSTLHRGVATSISDRAISNDFLGRNAESLLPKALLERTKMRGALSNKSLGTIIETAVARLRLEKREKPIGDLARWLKAKSVEAEVEHEDEKRARKQRRKKFEGIHEER